MNTHGIKLPPLPEDLIASMMLGSEVRSLMRRYGEMCARAAIEADRKRGGEPVHLFRRRGHPSGDFVTCSLERYAELSAMQDKFDTMIAYTAPQPAERSRGEPVAWLPIETAPEEGCWALVCGDGAMDCMFIRKGHAPENWTNPNNPNLTPCEVSHWMPLPEFAPQPTEPTDKDSLSVAAPVACFKCGHSKHGGECVNVAPQPAEPVKVPSDADAKYVQDFINCDGMGAVIVEGPQYSAVVRALLARYGSTTD